MYVKWGDESKQIGHSTQLHRYSVGVVMLKFTESLSELPDILFITFHDHQ